MRCLEFGAALFPLLQACNAFSTHRRSSKCNFDGIIATALNLKKNLFQHDRENRSVQSWSLICDVLLTRSIKDGTVFQLRQGDVSLLCSVRTLPHFNIAEEMIDAATNKFLLRHSNSETPV